MTRWTWVDVELGRPLAVILAKLRLGPGLGGPHVVFLPGTLKPNRLRGPVGSVGARDLPPIDPQVLDRASRQVGATPEHGSHRCGSARLGKTIVASNEGGR